MRVTSAPGITAPLGSWTVPVMVEKIACDQAMEHTSNPAAAASRSRTIRFVMFRIPPKRLIRISIWIKAQLRSLSPARLGKVILGLAATVRLLIPSYKTSAVSTAAVGSLTHANRSHGHDMNVGIACAPILGARVCAKFWASNLCWSVLSNFSRMKDSSRLLIDCGY